MIGGAIERAGELICVFDEHGMTLFWAKAKGSGPNDGLLGFSGSTVHACGRFDHLHVQRERHDAVRQGVMTDKKLTHEKVKAPMLSLSRQRRS